MKRWNVISGVTSTLFVALILTFGISTSIPSAAEAAPPDCKGPNKGGPNCPAGDDGGGTLRVKVTFDDDDADRLQSDCMSGNCPYVDKKQKVTTGIGQTGNLFIKFTRGG